MSNTNLSKAKKIQNDEFYTLYSDIEAELSHYPSSAFIGKKIYLPCDKPGKSAFWEYFYNNFHRLGLASLSASYKTLDKTTSTLTVYDGKEIINIALKGDGDFRNQENVDIAKQSDMIITNPPFSIMLEFLDFLIDNHIDFLIIGNSNSIFCRSVFPLIKSNKVRLGVNKPKLFEIPADYEAKNIKEIDGKRYATFGNICWYTTLPVNYSTQQLILDSHYEGNEDKYPKYENYNAIEVSKLKDIPVDYYGIMGCPISFIEKQHELKQFEIIWQASGNTRASAPKEILEELGYIPHTDDRGGACMLDGKRKYTRVFIRRII